MATVRTPIDPGRILWLKNVVRRDGCWAYCGDGPTPPHPEPAGSGDEFFLHWPTRLRRNANEPSKGDLIVLVQDGHVTHLVEVMDERVSDRPAEHVREGTPDRDFMPQRRVRAIAVRGRASAPTYSDALGFTPYVQGGAACPLGDLKRFQGSEWPRRGGLPALQAHLVEVFQH